MKNYVKGNVVKKLICSFILISILFSTVVFPIHVYANSFTNWVKDAFSNWTDEWKNVFSGEKSDDKELTGAQILSKLSDKCDSFVGFASADNKYNNFVNKLKKDDSRNSVEITNNKILVKATSAESVKKSLWPECCSEGEADRIVGNFYSDIIEIQIISTEPTDGEEDTRTEIEKIEDKLVDLGYSKTEAKIIVENNGYKVNDDGTVTVTLSAEDQRNLGVSDPTIAKVESENKSDWADELGGVLLRPIFALVNFIADSVIKITGKTMFPEAYGNGTTEIMTNGPVPLGYDEKTVQEVKVDVSDYEALSGDYYPQFRYTPEEIFSGQVNILSIDFISGKDSDGNTINNTGWTALRKVIAGWYKALRLIAAIGLLSVLIYTGVKIILSSTAKDKAKYKEWIVNWFIAITLLFTMHYIMSFIITINSEISNLLYTSTRGIKVIPVNGDGKIQSFTTNLMGLVRFHILEQSFKNKIAYEIMYIALIIYTLKFTFVYLKRVMYMAFLTLVAPIVALTYPIDKMNDGRAQGFEMWLKEYIFNAVLQILHFLLYHVLISSAIELAANNPIYAIVVLGFMNEAERLLKKIFGFDKAGGGTVGGMATAFAATSVASSLRSIGKFGKGPGGKGPGGKDDNKIGDFKPNTIDGTKGLLVDPNAQAPANVTETPTSAGTSGQGNGGANTNGRSNQLNLDNNESDSDPYLDQYAEYDNEFDNMPEPEDENYWDNNEDYLKGEDLLNQPPKSPTPPTVSANDNGTGNAQPTETPIQNLADNKEEGRLKKIGRGIGSLGKAAVRPIYDFDKTGAYNGKRLARNIARGALGAGMGVAAAAVQAGISITDGKYNPMEAVAAFSAGYAGAGAVTNKIEGIESTYMDGYNTGNNDAKMNKAIDDFKNRDDVIAAFKKKYGDEWKKQRERAAENYFAYGETDVSKMIKNMDNADKLMKSNNAVEENQKWDQNQADTQIRNIEKARKELKDMNMYGKIMNDNEQAEKFVQSQVQSYVKNELKNEKNPTQKAAEYEGKVRTLLSQMKQVK